MGGHITKRGNSYRIAVNLGKDTQTGRYIFQRLTVRGTKREAEKKLSELMH